MHSYKSLASFQIHCVSSDDVTILHGKPSTQKATVIMEDCQPGKYIAYVYEKTMVSGNHFDDFRGRSKCSGKIHNKVHPKPFKIGLVETMHVG